MNYNDFCVVRTNPTAVRKLMLFHTVTNNFRTVAGIVELIINIDDQNQRQNMALSSTVSRVK